MECRTIDVTSKLLSHAAPLECQSSFLRHPKLRFLIYQPVLLPHHRLGSDNVKRSSTKVQKFLQRCSTIFVSLESMHEKRRLTQLPPQPRLTQSHLQIPSDAHANTAARCSYSSHQFQSTTSSLQQKLVTNPGSTAIYSAYHLPCPFLVRLGMLSTHTRTIKGRILCRSDGPQMVLSPSLINPPREILCNLHVIDGCQALQ